MKLLGSLLITLAIAATALGAQAPIITQTPFVQLESNTGQQRLLADLDAYRTRQELQQLLRRYAPSLIEVFRIDPSLLTNQAFLAPYPNLAAFLAQHPEIAHNPRFFVGEGPAFADYNRNTNRASENFKDVLAGIALFTAGLVLLSVACWIIKNVIDHRRWLRISRVQSEVHSKLLDRFTSNQDLLAYVQTPAGRHFLESAPISLDAGPRSLSAPLGRILFSVQAGVVLALAGIGLNWVSRSVQEDIAQPLFVVGVLALAVGVGFVLSAGIAYVMSQRLGLLTPNPLASTSTNPGASPPHA
jgi:hypothetical protein